MIDDPRVKPSPLRCPACGDINDAWIWSDLHEEWDFDGEWWQDAQHAGPGHGYTCSRRCNLDRRRAA